MSARLRILTLFLLAGTLVARGQDLRTGVPVAGGGFLAAGDCLAWLDSEGNTLKIKPLERPLRAMAAMGDYLFAIDFDGHDLLRLDTDGDVAECQTLPVKGRLQALGADGMILWAVTDAGEIVHGAPVSGWTVFDFNAQYAGFYLQIDFRAVAAGGGSVMVAGLRPDGTPAAYTSARGTVWSERTLDYMDQGVPCLFTAEPQSLSYDAPQDRYYLLGSGGAQLALPGCSHCNALTRYPADTLYARIPGPSASLLLGADGFRRVEER
jgi:hypothetical protein